MNEQISEEQRKKKEKLNVGCLMLMIGIGIAFYFLFFKKDDKSPTNSSATYSTSTTNSTSGPSASSATDAYEIMERVFTGEPEKETVQPLIEAVMKRHSMDITNENLTKVANMLFVLRKESKVGVTEMEILKHVYQRGSDKISLSDQAAISSVYLEQTK